MRLRFTGKIGFKGLESGGIYDVRFRPRNAPFNSPFTALFLGTEHSYDSDVFFWKEWAPPGDTAAGEVQCAYSKRHIPHMWATPEGFTVRCPGVTEEE